MTDRWADTNVTALQQAELLRNVPMTIGNWHGEDMPVDETVRDTAGAIGAIGPLAAVVSLTTSGFAELANQVPVPLWVLFVGGLGIVLGLATYGYRVIATIGKEITEMTPTRGFAAEFGAATTVLIASRMGLPVSTTHVLVGAVVGVGFAQGIGALNMRVIRNIVGSWVATVPAAASVASILFLILRFAIV
mgnify:CR=1 FL=1